MKTAPLFAALLVACSSVDLEETGALDPGVPGGGGAPSSAVASTVAVSSSSVVSSSSLASSTIASSSVVLSSSAVSSSSVSSSASGAGGSTCVGSRVLGVDLGSLGWHVVFFDPETGALTDTGDVLPFQSISSSHVETADRVYFFSGESTVATVDKATGAILNVATASETFLGMGINAAGAILGIVYPTNDIATIDPATGEVTHLAANAGGMLDPQQGASDIANDLIYSTNNGVLSTIDGATGALIATIPVSDASFESPVVVAPGQLAGIVTGRVARLDPATGMVTPFGPMMFTPGAGETAFDPVCNAVLVWAMYGFHAIDLATGADNPAGIPPQTDIIDMVAVP